MSCVFLSLESLEEWIPDEEPDLDWLNRSRNPSNPDPDDYDPLVLQSLGEELRPSWQPEEIPLDYGRVLVLEIDQSSEWRPQP